MGSLLEALKQIDKKAEPEFREEEYDHKPKLETLKESIKIFINSAREQSSDEEMLEKATLMEENLHDVVDSFAKGWKYATTIADWRRNGMAEKKSVEHLRRKAADASIEFRCNARHTIENIMEEFYQKGISWALERNLALGSDLPPSLSEEILVKQGVDLVEKDWDQETLRNMKDTIIEIAEMQEIGNGQSAKRMAGFVDEIRRRLK